jgi:hypothetical protein
VRFGGLLGGAFLATLVNPYGPSLYGWVFQLLGDRYFMGLHVEWQSPAFHGRGAFLFESLMLAFPALMAVSRRRPNLIELGLSVLLLHFALTGLRYLPLWVLVAVPLLARSSVEVPALQDVVRRLGLDREGGLFAARPAVGSWAWTAAAAVALLGGAKLLEGRFAALAPEVIPTAALDRLLELHRERPGAVVFHSYNWGGYLTWHGWRPDGGGFRNWIDDRNEVQGQGHVEEFFAVLHAEPGWHAKLDRAGVVLVCVEPETALAYRLAESPGWREVHRDGHAVIFERAPGPPSSQALAQTR